MVKIALYLRKEIILAFLLLALTLIASSVQPEGRKTEIIPPASQIYINKNPYANNDEGRKTHLRDVKDALRIAPTPLPIPTPILKPSILGPNYDPTIDIHAGPVSLPLEIIIPILKVDAPILGVGLTNNNAMDAPKGAYGDPNWSSAFWYRNSAIPGEPGTATIAGHMNGFLGEPETFAHLRELKPDDLLIIKDDNSNATLSFYVDEVNNYSLAELNEPEIADRIFGKKVGSDENGLILEESHLTLITCTGNYIDGEYDHRIIVFSTLR